MEEGGLPPVTAPSSATADCPQQHHQQQQQQAVQPTGNEAPLDDGLSMLQELYQRRHAELLAQFQQSQSIAEQDYLLKLQLLQSALPAAAAMVVLQQQQIAASPNVASQQQQHSQQRPLLASLAHTSSEQSTEEFDVAAQQQQSQQQQQQQQTCSSVPLAKEHPAGGIAVTARNRRTFSGSGQTISQHTRDRLKSMIACKKQKQRLHSSSSAGSTSNIAASVNGGTANWGRAHGANSELSLLGGGGGGTDPNGGGAMAMSMVAAAASSHFDQRFLPYPHPVRHNAENNMANASNNCDYNNISPTDFQLRKVNSEPNLKMRIRARLLNKGSSPQQHQQPPANFSHSQPHSGTLPPPQQQQQQQPPPPPQGPDSTTAANHLIVEQKHQQQHLVTPSSAAVSAAAIDATALLQQAAQSAQQLAAAAAVTTSNLMMPSPSLPNLPMTATLGLKGGGGTDRGGASGTETGSSSSTTSAGGAQQQDVLNLLMQNPFMHFLSMPSLLRSAQLLPPNSMFDPPQQQMVEAAQNVSGGAPTPGAHLQRTVRFDNRSTPMSIGYPSLLKQQLRDLVLRRKSLVREEPEDDTMMDFSNNRTAQPGNESLLVSNQLKSGIAYDPSMAKHQCLCAENSNHVEHSGRVQSIWARLVEKGLAAVRKAPLELLRLVHSPTYVTFFAVSPTACLKMDPAELPLKSFVQLPCGGIGVDSDTYFNDASTQTAAKMAVGSLVELCCQVVEGKLRNGFACIRPPGHHAEREQAMGFCFFNNVAIAARYIQQRFAATCARIAIIDWDVHHGNGTQLCFENDPNCLYLSMHRHDNGNFFPGTGAVTEVGIGEGKGTTVNIPFSGDVMGDAEYLAAWRVLVLPLLDTFKPDFILVSAGFDAAQGHPAALGGYNLSSKIFGYFTRTLTQFANGRVVLALEGGYELSAICDSAEECVKALCSNGGEITQLSAETLEQIPNNSAQETIQKVIAVHKKHWPCLTGVQGINTSELHWQTISQRFSSLTVHSCCTPTKQIT
uniref:histone deacetylase n=1 Tax=Globodera rostochiensis TaxID=31243 RepID=A0A914ICJ4_GLORO